MRTKLRLISFLLLLFDLLADHVLCLGGKSFSAQSETNLTDRNYAMLMLCEPQLHQNIVMNMSLILNPFQENQLIRFQRAGVPFEISPLVENVTQVTVEASPWPTRLNVMRITFRLDNRLYKLHLNPNCDTGEVYWTSLKMSSYWGRYIDCDKSETICDDRADEITVCDRPFTYHIMWRNGIDRYE